jgi:probable lipoprotein NlpC
MSWSNNFVGIPFADKGRSIEGADCWGLVVLVLESFEIIVPSYSDKYASSEERELTASIINHQKTKWQKIEFPHPGDVVLFKMGKHLSHAGIFVEGDKFLHMAKDDSSMIDDLTKQPWSRRFSGFYRWCK